MSKSSQRKLAAFQRGYKEAMKDIPTECYRSIKKSRRSTLYIDWRRGFAAGKKVLEAKYVKDKQKAETPTLQGYETL